MTIIERKITKGKILRGNVEYEGLEVYIMGEYSNFASFKRAISRVLSAHSEFEDLRSTFFTGRDTKDYKCVMQKLREKAYANCASNCDHYPENTYEHRTCLKRCVEKTTENMWRRIEEDLTYSKVLSICGKVSMSEGHRDGINSYFQGFEFRWEGEDGVIYVYSYWAVV